MRFRRPFVVALVLVGAASAQTTEDGLRSEIKAVCYAPLAEQAQIQGDVHLNVKSGVVTLLSGHRYSLQSPSGARKHSDRFRAKRTLI